MLRLGRVARIVRVLRILRGVRATSTVSSFILSKRAQSTFLAPGQEQEKKDFAELRDEIAELKQLLRTRKTG